MLLTVLADRKCKGLTSLSGLGLGLGLRTGQGRIWSKGKGGGQGFKEGERLAGREEEMVALLWPCEWGMGRVSCRSGSAGDSRRGEWCALLPARERARDGVDSPGIVPDRRIGYALSLTRGKASKQASKQAGLLSLDGTRK